MSNKIGRRMKDEIRWPETDVLGRPYRRPATTRNIGKGTFVVVPAGVAREVIDAAIEELTQPKEVKRADDGVQRAD